MNPMEGEAGGEFQDWEVLPSNSDETRSVNTSDSVEDIMKGLEEGIVDGDSQGMIQTDYFSLDSHSKDVKEEGCVESDNPSWIDPGTVTRFPRKDSGEFWPDSGSDRSDDHKFSEFAAKHELGFAGNEKSQVGFEFGEFDAKYDLGFAEIGKSHVGFEGIGEIGAEGEDLRKIWSDSGGIRPISMGFGEFEHKTDMGIGVNANSPKGSEVFAEENSGDGKAGGDETSKGEESAAIGAVKSSGEEEKRSIVWWKVPFEFLKYCALRVNPVWTFSVAAAVMGFVILGRRLYKMKRKSQSLQLKVTMDDKKVSQFMSRTARLNEAFSVVKRVPVIRPSLPAAGVTPWPVMSLR